MSGSANHGAYGNPGVQNSPWGPGSGWGNPGWDPGRAWYAAKPLWIAAMILGFIFWWPVGLALLFFGIWSKRMGYSGCGRHGAWQGGWQRGNWQGGAAPAVGRVEELLVRRRPSAAAGLQRQPRLRRIPRRDVASAGGGAEGVRHVPRPAALRQGQGRVRPVHGRAPQPSADLARAAATADRSGLSSGQPRQSAAADAAANSRLAARSNSIRRVST